MIFYRGEQKPNHAPRGMSVRWWIGRLNWLYGYGILYRSVMELQTHLRMKRAGYTSADISSLVAKQRQIAAGEMVELTQGERNAQLDGWMPAPANLKL